MRIALLLSLMGLFPAVIAAAFLPESVVNHGREIYAVQKCALCHAIAGIGGKKSDLDGIGSKLKAEDIRKWIRTPKDMKANPTMKPFPSLSEKDLSDLIAFLSTLR